MQEWLYRALGSHTELTGVGSPAPRHHPGGSPALLALHGFGATPRELDPVVDVAEKLGLRAAAPLLPGHGTSFEDFATTGWQDWYGAADRELDMGELPRARINSPILRDENFLMSFNELERIKKSLFGN